MISKSKADMRNKYTQIRNAMTQEEVKSLSAKITETLCKLPVYKNAQTVMVYLSFNNEVDSMPLIEQCFKQGKRVVIPYCKKEGFELVPTELRDIETELQKSKMGYLETKKEFLRPVPLDEIDLIVIPAIAYDGSCHRLGYGAGYYDRFLEKVNFSIDTIGVVYDFQVMDVLPALEPTDIPVDYVITEKRILIGS